MMNQYLSQPAIKSLNEIQNMQRFVRFYANKKENHWTQLPRVSRSILTVCARVCVCVYVCMCICGALYAHLLYMNVCTLAWVESCDALT